MRPLEDIARNGVLKAAINTGNSVLVQQKNGTLTGISPALAGRLADELGAVLQPVLYGGAGKVFNDAGKGVWDVAFLAVDPERATRVSFTRSYTTIEATFAVRADSPLTKLSEIDRPGVRVLTSLGSAYELHLSKTLKHASLDRSGTPPESLAMFRSGDWNAVAGVRGSLEDALGDDPAYRLLPGSLTNVEQAMVLPEPDHPAIRALDSFVERAIASGFVASVLENGASG